MYNQIEKSNENYYKEREENIKLKERVQGAISKEESEKIKKTNDLLKMREVDLNAALTTFRSLYENAVNQAKVMRLTVEKVRNESENQFSIIKELESGSD